MWHRTRNVTLQGKMLCNVAALVSITGEVGGRLSVPLSDVLRVGTWTCIEREVYRKLLLEKDLWPVALVRNGTVDHIVNTCNLLAA
jgi:ubiquitin C-terminal hydrolase